MIEEIEVFDPINVDNMVESERIASVEFFEVLGGGGGGGGSGGGTIPPTTNILRGDGTGNAADTGIASASLVLKQPGYPTPGNINEIITLLQAAGLCV